MEPDDPEALFNRAAAYSRMGKTETALRDYDEAIRLNPNYTEAYVDRGNIRYAKGRLRSGHPGLLPGIGTESRQRGVLVSQGGRPIPKPTGIRTPSGIFRPPWLLNPKYVDALVRRGAGYVRAKLYDAAIKDLSQALELSPANAEAWYSLGTAHHYSGDDEAAVGRPGHGHPPQSPLRRSLFQPRQRLPEPWDTCRHP